MEIFHSGKWGTICDDNWDNNDATVVCRQLGYNYSIRVLGRSQVPRGTGQIWLDKVDCLGSELSLDSCSHSGWGNRNCGHSKDAGVVCSFTGTIKIISVSIHVGGCYCQRFLIDS